MTRPPFFKSRLLAGLAATLIALPAASGALAQSHGPDSHGPDSHNPAHSAAEAAVEARAAAFEARMEDFGRRADAISRTQGLNDAQREHRVAALWSEFQPEVAIFTAAIAQQAGAIAAAALAGIDLNTIVGDALADSEVRQALEGAQNAAVGMVNNGAWAQDDPEQMITYGLMAQYGLDQAMDAEAEANAADAEIEASPAASQPSAPLRKPKPKAG